ncbi:MAG: hypothetical protein HLX51_04455 [Micrococcaceae bacterium]|nr:hypothetical protein [Micrococcaceae bacterium]
MTDENTPDETTDEHTPDETPDQTSSHSGSTAADKGSTARARRREAALRRLDKKGPSKRAAVVFGLGAVAAVAAITAAGSLWAPDAPDMNTAAQAAQLPATPTYSVCPGMPMLPEGSEDGGDLDFSPDSSDAVSALAVAATSDLAGNIPGISYYATETDPAEQPSTTQITESLDEETQQGPPATAATDGTVANNAHYEVISDPDESGLPIALATEPVGGSPGTAAASAQYAATDGDLAGMSVAACGSAAHQHWLPGATTTTGTTSVVTVSNPSATNSTVNLTVYGEDGPIDASGASGIVLAPGQTQSMLVAGLAPGENSVAVQVSSSGGPVSADIQQHRLDGIVPAGVDTLQAATTGSNVVIPGLTIDDDAADIADGSGLDGQSPTLHVASTGSAASATITLRGPDGPVDLPTKASAIELAPGATTTVDLSGVEPGTYSVEIDADATVAASATSLAYNPAGDNEDATGNTSAIDTAYMPSTAPIRGETMVALPSVAEPESQLVLTSSEDDTVTITPVDAEGQMGEEFTQEIAADSAVTVDEEASAYLVETGSNAVHAGVMVDSSAGISAMPVNTVSETGSGLPVRLGY